MKVFLEKEKKHKKLVFNGTTGSLLKKLKTNPESVLVIRNDELVTLDTQLKDSDSITILSVISGG